MLELNELKTLRQSTAREMHRILELINKETDKALRSHEAGNSVYQDVGQYSFRELFELFLDADLIYAKICVQIENMEDEND